jgi:hypothetical protein
MSKRKKGDYEKRFLLAVAKAARAKQHSHHIRLKQQELLSSAQAA